MDLLKVKDLIRNNSVFEIVDSDDGLISITTEDTLDVEFAESAFFEEGGSPREPAIQTEDVQLDILPGHITGKDEEAIARKYLLGFYLRVLSSLAVGAGSVAEKSIVDSAGFEKLFDSLPNKYTGEVCLLSTHGDFQKALGVAFASPPLGIRFNQAGKMHNRDLLAWGEPLILTTAAPKGKIIAAERISIVLNLPQRLVPNGKDRYETEMRYKVIYPNRVLVYSI